MPTLPDRPPALAQRVRRLRNYGSERRYVHDEAGRNSRLDELQAAYLRVKLPHLAADNARRATIAAQYRQALAGLPGVVARLAPDDLLSAPASVDWRLAHMTPATRFQRAPHAHFEIGPAGPHGGVAVRFFAGHGPALAQPTGEVEVSPGTTRLATAVAWHLR